MPLQNINEPLRNGNCAQRNSTSLPPFSRYCVMLTTLAGPPTPITNHCGTLNSTCRTSTSLHKTLSTVDREIFALKIIRVKIFRVDKFSRFRSIREIFLTVDDCNMDERLESFVAFSLLPGIRRTRNCSL